VFQAAARVAGVSSFGLGGTNAHLIVSGPVEASPRRTPQPSPAFNRRRLWFDRNGATARPVLGLEVRSV